MRAFNGECDAAIANTRWNNIVAMEKRIRNAANQINKVNASVHLTITNDYIDLKIKELYLTHECGANHSTVIDIFNTDGLETSICAQQY